MTFWGHLDVLRGVIFRALAVIFVAAFAVMCMKEDVFHILLAPSSSDFVTYGWISSLLKLFGLTESMDDFKIHFISTELSAQFMIHLGVSLAIGLLITSPYVLYELYRFVAPGLYEKERRFAMPLLFAGYAMFFLGLACSYFIIFPMAFRFFYTYTISPDVTAAITVSSYFDTMLNLSIALGLAFQLPVLVWILGKAGLLHASWLRKSRRYAIVAILVVSAIITPPDIMSLILVSLPLYLLFEASIMLAPK